ncbi:Glucuronokinase 1 [Capsicum baccatum]|uniref:Glucuronokinase 1 n=1 Tax=Capsicum baccatum TaxID=33114 RepID=A0A2G2XD13_CAPBA|nr:Glucuronokinase 1 [Capsicum baccatum]
MDLGLYLIYAENPSDSGKSCDRGDGRSGSTDKEAASKFPESGGTVVVFCPHGPSQVKQLKDARQDASFVYETIEIMSSF